jgi:phage tail sheath gpL-like
VRRKLAQQLTAELLANHAALAEAAADRPPSHYPLWAAAIASVAFVVAAGADPDAPTRNAEQRDLRPAPDEQLRRPADD